MQSSEIDTERTEKGCIDKATASSEIFNRYLVIANINYVKLSVNTNRESAVFARL
jgi:hypothetical protein